MTSAMKVIVPLIGLCSLFGTAWQRQAQAEERFAAAIAEQPAPPHEVAGQLSDGAELARLVLQLQGN